jgi:hypothetical protein
MPDGEVRWIYPASVPARARDAGGVTAGVEAEAGHDHEDVLTVGVDIDPPPGPRLAPVPGAQSAADIASVQTRRRAAIRPPFSNFMRLKEKSLS